MYNSVRLLPRVNVNPAETELSQGYLFTSVAAFVGPCLPARRICHHLVEHGGRVRAGARHLAPLVDIRTIPRSGHNPQFNREELAASLRMAGITYEHRQGLGGLRHPRKDSPNGGWRNSSFRGFCRLHADFGVRERGRDADRRSAVSTS